MKLYHKYSRLFKNCYSTDMVENGIMNKSYYLNQLRYSFSSKSQTVRRAISADQDLDFKGFVNKAFVFKVNK